MRIIFSTLILTILIAPSLSYSGTRCKIKSALRSLAGPLPKNLTRPEALEQIELAFQNTNLINFIDGTKLKKIPDGELQDGSSYTVNIRDVNGVYTLDIGKNIKGVDGRIGGRRSHATLDSAIYDNQVDGKYLYQYGGAIRFHRDGTVDVSGYHYQDEDKKSAKEIFKILQKIYPKLKGRLSGKRLKDFPPYKP